MNQSQLTYIPFSPIIDLGFWTTLSKKKIEQYKLDESSKDIWAKYKINPYQEKTSHLNFDIYSFSEPNISKSGPFEQYIESTFQNFNTVEQYRSQDTHSCLKFKTRELYDKLKAGGSKIIKSHLFMFADLKKYLFTYKLIVPTLRIEEVEVLQKSKLQDIFADSKQIFTCLKQQINSQDSKDQISQPFFFIDSQTYQQISLEQLNENHQNDRIGSGFQNFLGYLILNNVKDARICVIKDVFSYNGQKFELKNSQFLHLNLSNAKIELDSDNNPKFNDIDHYSQEKSIDLKGFMDEKLLARDAVDLNIKLMKWRMLPELDLNLIKSTKCILFGAGTLGCQLARNLIGWGIRHITFVDYGRVSYSNPVRQSLFDFEDSCNGGLQKAEVAAERLKKIFPDISANGISIEIPMPGHYVGEVQYEKTIESINIIDQLVQEHDAVFLLTDSRESRWFPTLLANKHQKISFAVALGFDSFCVIRQGTSVLKYDPQIHGDRLGCYFCNDISAPQDSMRDRTLDQQCTVTRPGLSFLASAYTSELLISLLHHPLREATPASDDVNELQSTDLGLLPHFLRGQISDFEVRIFYGKAFQNCVACSKNILDEYLAQGEQFIIKVMNQSNHLQDVSGITAQIQSHHPLSEEIEMLDDFAVIQ